MLHGIEPRRGRQALYKSLIFQSGPEGDHLAGKHLLEPGLQAGENQACGVGAYKGRVASSLFHFWSGEPMARGFNIPAT